MASMARSDSENQSWSSWVWTSFTRWSPNFSVWAWDGDHDERMADDLSYMELRDGKRIDHPWEKVERY